MTAATQVPDSTALGWAKELVLPMPETDFVPCKSARCARTDCAQSVRTNLRLLEQAGCQDRPARPRPPTDPDGHTRYRWITGHQVAFGVWRLLTDKLRALLDDPHPDPSLVRDAARLYDTYSFLLLYTGSCTARRYATTVRSDMAARHPAFSGQWTRDHTALPDLLRQVRRAFPAPAVTPLTEAVRLNRRTHMAIAERLVPDGISLLRQTGRDPAQEPTETERDLSDDYFLVRRRPLCHDAFAAQIVQRIALITCDLASHGLAAAHMPSTPHHPGVRRLSHEAPELLVHLAETATAHSGLPARPSPSPILL